MKLILLWKIKIYTRTIIIIYNYQQNKYWNENIKLDDVEPSSKVKQERTVRIWRILRIAGASTQPENVLSSGTHLVLSFPMYFVVSGSSMCSLACEMSPRFALRSFALSLSFLLHRPMRVAPNGIVVYVSQNSVSQTASNRDHLCRRIDRNAYYLWMKFRKS